MVDTPVVSVIVPCFNRADTVIKALDTARMQSVPHEIIVVDDASKDDLRGVIEGLNDPVVSYHRLEQNQGPSAARNVAIRHARADWIALLDSDDRWLPGKLEAQLAYAKTEDLPACSTWYVNEFGAQGNEVLCRPEEPKYSVEILTRGSLFGLGTTLLARREIFDVVGGFPEELRRMEDAEWLARYLRSHRFGVMPEVLARVSATPVTATGCGGQLFLDCIGAFHERLAPEFTQLSPPVRRRYQATELDWAAWAFFREGAWRPGFGCMARSLRLRPLRSPGNLLNYFDAMTGTNLAALAERLRQTTFSER